MASLSNNEIKKIKSLSQKKFRDELGLFVVEGDKLVEEALRSDFDVVEVYRRDEIGPGIMARISSLSSPSPSIALVRIPEEYRKVSDASDPDKDKQLSIPAKGLLLGLDTIRDPGNLGTIIRAADWFGVEDVYASRGTVELFNPKVVQSTMGAVFRVRVHYCSLPGIARGILGAGGRVYGTFLDGMNMYECSLECGEKAPVMAVIGNEADGISPETAAAVSDRIKIPSYGFSKCESLNAASAAAVCLAEFRRRITRE